MDLGAGGDTPKSTTPAPSQQSSKSVEPSTMVKKQGGEGGGDAPSTSSSVPVGTRKGPSEHQIAAMASAKVKKNGRGGKKNGYIDLPTYPEDSATSSSRRGDGRGGGRCARPRPQTQHYDYYDDDYDDQANYQPHYNQRGRGNSRKLGNQRGQ